VYPGRKYNIGVPRVEIPRYPGDETPRSPLVENELNEFLIIFII
jgi:hypothetical protein